MPRFLLAVVVTVFSGCLARDVRGDGATPEVTLASLEGDLEGQGAWLELPALGRVWQPAEAFAGSSFFPYGTGGRWVLTEAGWVFDSQHPFGWATFHYGRWSLEPDLGWVWQPGTAWAPAWVAWRTGPRAIGWAPLGPQGTPPLGAARWSFIEPKHLGALDPRLGALSADRFDEAALQTRAAPGDAARTGPTAADLGPDLAPRPRALRSFERSARPAATAAFHRESRAEVRRPAVRPALEVAPAVLADAPLAAASGDSHRSSAPSASLAPRTQVRAPASAPTPAQAPVASAVALPDTQQAPGGEPPPSVSAQRSQDRLKVR